MDIGFTGSQDGITSRQKDALTSVFRGLIQGGAKSLRNGDCVGADATAGILWWGLGGDIILHPPTDSKKRAFLDRLLLGPIEVNPPRSYLARNKDIVGGARVLIATPSGPEKLRSGTWSTVRYARKMGIPSIIVWPDGDITTDAI